MQSYSYPIHCIKDTFKLNAGYKSSNWKQMNLYNFVIEDHFIFQLINILKGRNAMVYMLADCTSNSHDWSLVHGVAHPGETWVPWKWNLEQVFRS